MLSPLQKDILAQLAEPDTSIMIGGVREYQLACTSLENQGLIERTTVTRPVDDRRNPITIGVWVITEAGRKALGD